MEWHQAVSDFIDRLTWLDPISQSVQNVVKRIYESGGRTGLAVRDFLHGTWLGHPLHSVLTDVPVGSLTVAVTLDALEMATGREEFGVGADAAVALGIGGMVSSAVAGITDWHHTSGRARRMGMLHAIFNVSGLLLFIASFILRRRRNRTAGWGLALLGYSAMTAGAYLGGHLVYSEKVGVDHAPNQSLPEKFTPILALDDLPEDKLHRVEINNIPVLLVRRGQKVFALAETCAHLGGPLAEGELKPDNSVICPWHGSRYLLEDGGLVNGPSVYTQPCFETRIRSDQVEIRIGSY